MRGADDRSLLDDVRVTYFEIGSGRWRTASRWMPLGARRDLPPRRPGGSGRSRLLRAGEVRASGNAAVYPVPVAGLCTRSASQWTAGLAAVPGCETDNQLNDQLGTAWETSR